MGLELEWETETLDDGRIQSQADCGGYVACVQSFGQSVGVSYWAAFVCKAGRLPVEESRSAWSNHDAESLTAAQEAAEAAAARLLAEDAGVRALMGLDELRVRAEKAEIDGECYRLAAQHHYKQYTEADTALTRVVTKLGNTAIRVARLEAALRWIPVTERLPDEGLRVLVACEGDEDEPYIMTLRRSAVMDGGYYWEDDAGAGGAVLHLSDLWRPLGAGPVAGNSADSANLAATVPGGGE